MRMKFKQVVNTSISPFIRIVAMLHIVSVGFHFLLVKCVLKCGI